MFQNNVSGMSRIYMRTLTPFLVPVNACSIPQKCWVGRKMVLYANCVSPFYVTIHLSS